MNDDVPPSGEYPNDEYPNGESTGENPWGTPGDSTPSWSHETQPLTPESQPPSPYGAPTAPPPGFTTPYSMPSPYGQPPEPARRERRHGLGAGLAAGLIVGALVFGGGAGLAASAVYHHQTQNQSAPLIESAGGGGTSTTTNPNAPAGSVEKVAADVLPSVVKIEVEGSTEAGSGSGIILSSDGEILTNNHVVAIAGNNGRIRVDFNDGTSAVAKVLGTDPLTDTAVIKAENVSGLKPATIGKSSSLAVGQSVVAIGSPFGLDSTVTSGIVSALNRPVNVSQDATNATVYPAIQTDAAINPGNSGGALVDLSGAVVGINASIRTTSTSSDQESGSIGLGFAIPIDYVMPIIQQMINGETPTHARLGISVEDPSTDNTTGLFEQPGAKVAQVTAGSAAAAAGMKVGDIVTKVDNQLITSSDSLVATIRSYRPGDTVHVTWTRSGHTMSANIKLDSDADLSNS